MSSFQIFLHQNKKREIGIEKMKINEEIYRSIIAPEEETPELDSEIRRLEAALRRQKAYYKDCLLYTSRCV